MFVALTLIVTYKYLRFKKINSFKKLCYSLGILGIFGQTEVPYSMLTTEDVLIHHFHILCIVGHVHSQICNSLRMELF